MFGRLGELEEDLDDTLLLLAAAQEVEAAEAQEYLEAFPSVLARLPDTASVRARMRKELADAEDGELSEVWVNVSRRCARLAQARLSELERQAEAAEQARRRRAEEERRKQEEAARAARVRRDEEAARRKREEEARVARLRREADAAEQRKLAAQRAALQAEQERLVAERRRDALKRENAVAAPSTRAAVAAPPMRRATAASSARPDHESVSVNAPTPAPEEKRYTGDDLIDYRVRRGLTVGLCAQHLGVPRDVVVAAEADPKQPLNGPALSAVRAVLRREAEMDVLLPPELVESERPPKAPAPKGPAAPGDARTGDDLHAWRMAKGLNQSEAAKRLGVSQGYIAKAEGAGSKPLGPALHAALLGAKE